MEMKRNRNRNIAPKGYYSAKAKLARAEKKDYQKAYAVAQNSGMSETDCHEFAMEQSKTKETHETT